MKVLIIDNYDSFTFNLYQYVGELLEEEPGMKEGEVLVKRNNAISLEEIKEMAPQRIILSPGPGHPGDDEYFGICKEVILNYDENVPLLGVCLGMQGMVHHLGGSVVVASKPMHGKVSPVLHDRQGLFTEIPQGIEVMRYHSLVASRKNLPDALEITSLTMDLYPEVKDFDELKKLENTEIMGIRHKSRPLFGIQYHPESFGTEGGRELLRNFLFRL